MAIPSEAAVHDFMQVLNGFHASNSDDVTVRHFISAERKALNQRIALHRDQPVTITLAHEELTALVERIYAIWGPALMGVPEHAERVIHDLIKVVLGRTAAKARLATFLDSPNFCAPAGFVQGIGPPPAAELTPHHPAYAALAALAAMDDDLVSNVDDGYGSDVPAPEPAPYTGDATNSGGSRTRNHRGGPRTSSRGRAQPVRPHQARTR